MVYGGVFMEKGAEIMGGDIYDRTKKNNESKSERE